MWNLLCILICALDGFVVGTVAVGIVASIFGNRPLGRLLKIVLGVGLGGAYFAYTVYIAFGADVGLTTGAIIVFGPATVLLLLLLLAYICKGKS